MTEEFPLAVGDHWEYALEAPSAGLVNRDVVQAVDMDGGPAYVVLSGDPALAAKQADAYRRNATEVVQWSNNTLATAYSRGLAPTLYLKLPLKVGDKWNVVDTVSVGELDRTVRQESTTVAAIEPVITYGAGTFSNAFRVETNKYLAQTYTSSPIQNCSRQFRTEWLVPGVGLVKYSEGGDNCAGSRYGTTTSLKLYRLAPR